MSHNLQFWSLGVITQNLDFCQQLTICVLLQLATFWTLVTYDVATSWYSAKNGAQLRPMRAERNLLTIASPIRTNTWQIGVLTTIIQQYETEMSHPVWTTKYSPYAQCGGKYAPSVKYGEICWSMRRVS